METRPTKRVLYEIITQYVSQYRPYNQFAHPTHPPTTDRPMAESAISADVQKNVTWNFNVNLIDVIFITIGMSLISRRRSCRCW